METAVAVLGSFSAFQYNTTVKLDISKMWDVIVFQCLSI